MYEFLTGPMLWAAFLIFVIGLARRVVLYIRGLDWRLERVAYGPGRKIGMKGAISSVLQWLVPFGTHSWRRQPYFTIAFFLFHIVQERFGFSLPSLPMWFSDAFTVLAIVGAFMMILRRVALPEVRFLTTLGDWGILLLVLFVLVAGFLARMQAPGYESWLLWHIFAAELVLILAPFTKLSHIVLYFMSRGQLGMDYAIKRGGEVKVGMIDVVGNPPGLPAYWRTTCLKASFATDGPSTPRKI